jgi:uncharacterized protein YcaQ
MAVASQLLADDQAASSPLDVLGHLGAIQLDAMQRVDKSHRLVCFARTEFPGGRETIDEYFWVQAGEATAFEAWAHAVSLIPVDDWPLWGFRRQSTRSVTWAPQAGLSDRLVGLVRDAGPQTIRELEAGGARSSGWDWSETKKAAEYLVWTGVLVCCARAGTRRLYDLAERRIPAHLLCCDVSEEMAIAALTMKAAKACGIATVGDLAAYFQLSRDAVAGAVEEIGLVRAEVEGWQAAAWIHPAAMEGSMPTGGPVFLSPFDNLIWNRDRTRRVFDFDYTLEAYKPAAKRTYGYYVMPLLADGEIRGRADIGREHQTLRVIRFYPEPGGVAPDTVIAAATRLARQLGCQAADIPDQPVK